MSGAAPPSDGPVIGVIATEPAGRGHAVLEAVPISPPLRDPAFAAHTGFAVARCEAVGLRP